MPTTAKGATTLISAGTTVSGDITFSGNLDVEAVSYTHLRAHETS